MTDPMTPRQAIEFAIKTEELGTKVWSIAKMRGMSQRWRDISMLHLAQSSPESSGQGGSSSSSKPASATTIILMGPWKVLKPW